MSTCSVCLFRVDPFASTPWRDPTTVASRHFCFCLDVVVHSLCQNAEKMFIIRNRSENELLSECHADRCDYKSLLPSSKWLKISDWQQSICPHCGTDVHKLHFRRLPISDIEAYAIETAEQRDESLRTPESPTSIQHSNTKSTRG